MPDMLVKLYELPEYRGPIEELNRKGFEIRRPIGPEKHIVLDWVKQEFGRGWMSECDISFSNHPISCLIAVYEEKIVGFACYDATCKSFFGPTGVKEDLRGHGLGKALLLKCLHAMREQGYGYAIIGDPGPIEFYKKTVHAIEIENSSPGIFRGMLSQS